MAISRNGRFLPFPADRLSSTLKIRNQVAWYRRSYRIMDPSRFDHWTKSLPFAASRRRALLALAVGIPGLAEAKKKKRKNRKRNKKKIKRNAFGCVNVGNFCKNSGQCCSGICEGKKGKKKCQGHDQSTCQAGQTIEDCGGVAVDCTTTSGDEGSCLTTTGNAGYCFSDGDCFPCAKDADCVPFCGPQAACIACAGEECGEEGGTACVGPSDDSCEFPDGEQDRAR
jgi:hypothetical protein